MEDQNNKKGYDDFFNAKEGEERAEKGDKPSYYYSYGPMPSKDSSSISSDSQSQDSRVYSIDEAAVQAQPPQLRTFTPAGSGNNVWQVKEKRGTSFKSIFLSFLTGVLVVGGLMYTADVRNWFTSGSEAATTQSSGNGSAATANSSNKSDSAASTIAARPDNIAQLFRTASPAVVKIETFVNARTRSGSSLFDDPFFRQFFGDNNSGAEESERQQEGNMQQSGIGTGFFFDSTGYILTNQHVIGDADEIRITVQGYDKPFIGKLLGSIYDLDLAVVKIEGENEFPTLPLGSSDDINIGDWVVAIGNPYGFDHTITVGVLSAKERPIDIRDQEGERNYKHLLQTDASINPGNSGGPLLNVKGEVIGINTAVSSQAQGIGFAIPTSTINEVLDNLKNNTEVPKEPAPFIGATLVQVNDEIANRLGLEKVEGSFVRDVTYNSPAYLSDLKQYDVIIGIEGQQIVTTDALIKEIQSRKVGESVEFNVIRQGKEISLKVEIGDKNVFGIE